MHRYVKYGAMAFLGIMFLILPVSVPVLKSSADYSMFNSDWNGCSKFVQRIYERGGEIRPLGSVPTTYEGLSPIFLPYNTIGLSNKSGVLLIIGPNVTFSDYEIAEIKKFLENGNTVFIADDFGTGNEILTRLNIPVRISKYPLNDLFYERSDKLIVVTRIEDPILGDGVNKLVLNVPSALIIKEGEIYASRVAMINYHQGMYPILAEFKYSNGRIIVLSDPDILINEMYDDNSKFIDNLLDYIGGEIFYFDEAHHPDFNPYITGVIYIHRNLTREMAFEVFLLFTILAFVVESGLISRGLGKIGHFVGRFWRKGETLEDILAEVANEHNLDLEKLKKMIEEIERGSKLGGRYGRKRVLRKA
ncbi:DUF4350 domain-containing protein [Thermococcus sp. M39]|uniref:DUF4350 domain-containing protein n=1 Tax=unclassified Thermococcus TaxID=2627626 RepID=UPI001439FFC0|nr:MULTISPECIES: DUF4350 domain-containing protein [unclassified Thermococcus]NJE06975.1 DUF4350 domain-containing protein [Thermococcus sp. M39]NJE12869.1 DUF4350 domain-containing protein [Thermococcus sp. LS2]